MAEEEQDVPYKAEYAKSNRSSCKACKSTISKESLRVARMVQSPSFDGKMPLWYHLTCFFKKFHPASSADVGGFHSLRWEDQEKIKKHLPGGEGGGEVGSAPGKKGAAGKGKKTAAGKGNATSKVELNHDYKVEYAKSSRSTCRQCLNFIDKDDLRVCILEEPDADDPRLAYSSEPIPRWHHYACFKKNLVSAGVTADMLPGFTQIRRPDQEVLFADLGRAAAAAAVTTGTKRGAGAVEETDAPKKKKKSKEHIEEEKQLKGQSQLLWSVRDMLSRNLSTAQMKELLRANRQEVPPGESRLLDRCCDGMVFGALETCGTCDGQLVYSATASSYVCTGNVSGWTKCSFSTQKPNSGAWKIPSALKSTSDELKKFKFVSRSRVFPDLTAPPQPVKVAAAESTDGPAAAREGADNQSIAKKQEPVDRKAKLLGDLKVVVVGRLSKTQAKIAESVTKMGGTVVSKATEDVDICISNKEEVAKLGVKMAAVQKADIPVIDEAVLQWETKSGTDPPSLQDSCLSLWGKERFQATYIALSKRAPSKSAQAPPAKKQKLVVKGGAVVDPDSGLVHSHHILQSGGATYNVVLGMVDIKRGSNSYYKLQVLQGDQAKSFYLFRAWGRVGTDIGGNKCERMSSVREAVDEFERLYEEKTGNMFDKRGDFVKHPSKFFPLEMDYGQGDEDLTASLAQAGSRSRLDPAVQDLIRMIFDVQKMKQAMMEFEIDMQKMPLGKLSKKQIQHAYRVLSLALSELEGGKDSTKLLDCSNQFFTLIPHDFGMKKPPLLDNEKFIKEKTDMLDNLLEIEIAYNMLRESVASGEKDPLDVHYEQLKADIKPLPKDSEDFKLIEEYVANTHGSTHTAYRLEVQEVFELRRQGEEARFKPFRKLHNHKLLWHGSRRTNFGGIISQGLRIAPPEAPTTGYMFGKGVYFADMVTKSSNYCFTNHQDPLGLMLLCDVALGNMYDLAHAKYVTKLPPGKHSTKGCGRTCPAPGDDFDMEGVVVPKGKGVSSGAQNTSLLYNEYIVYDVAQIRMKYLLKLKFNYQRGGLG